MLWVTRARIHLDRVASPWLIARFVDREATFGFLVADEPAPVGAVPFALPGAELGPHDGSGSTFRKILDRFDVKAPELQAMARCVEAGIAVALGRPLADADSVIAAQGRAMASFSEAMAALHDGDDQTNLAASAGYYDALYVTLWSAFGDSPSLPGDVVARIEALRAARDWRALLPPWPASFAQTSAS